MNSNNQISCLNLRKFKDLPQITIDLEHILSLQGDINYTILTYLNPSGDIESRKTSHTIGKYQALLPSDRFIRIHRNTILNTQYIKNLIEDTVVETTDNKTHTISRRYKKIVLDNLKLHLDDSTKE